MPSGRRTLARLRHGGFTYLWLLFALALAGTGLAAAAQTWHATAWRAREHDSMARGQELADALGAWRLASQALGQAAQPGPFELEELLEDRRGPILRRHLRRVWADPLTGQADWIWLRDEQGALQGLHSRSQRPALLRQGPLAACVCDRVFRPGLPPQAPPPAPQPPAAVAPA